MCRLNPISSRFIIDRARTYMQLPRRRCRQRLVRVAATRRHLGTLLQVDAYVVLTIYTVRTLTLLKTDY